VENNDELVRRTFNNFLADAKVEMPAAAEQRAISADTSFVSKPAKLGLAEK
jgi:hypothetical protein